MNILRKMNVTVVIGCKVKGEVHTHRNIQLFYDNNFKDASLFYENGQEFKLLDGKFESRANLDEETGEYVEWYSKVINKKNKK